MGLVLLLLTLAGAISSPALISCGVWAFILGSGAAALMTFSSRVGKRWVSDRLLTSLELRGDEDVLDLGCGSGLLLLEAAARLPAGTATGVDVWRSRDQAGSSRRRCIANAELLSVRDRIRLVDHDMTELPFPDASFDVVMTCLAVHNLRPAARRETAIREAARVLRPGGRFALIDVIGTAACARIARDAGLIDVRRSGFDLGIFPPARIVTGRAPG